MAKKEIKTDLQISRLLDEADIKYDAQGSDIKEINEALKTASKNKTGKAGYPEFVALSNGFLLVIEDKPNNESHCLYDDNKNISFENNAIKDYAVNGAIWYAKHIAKNTNFNKIFAFGCSGCDKNLRISPFFVDDRDNVIQLNDVDTFYNFSNENIKNYYTREVLNEETDTELETQDILRLASELHNDLRDYGNLQNKEKPIVVSGILLALREENFDGFDVDKLNCDPKKTDGKKIFEAISNNLDRSNVEPGIKKDKILSQFNIIKNSDKLNEYNEKLGKSPLKYYTEFLKKNIYKPIVNMRTTEDYLGRFYGEFMSYGDNDGQSLGIILTPKHITDLFCDLVELKTNDIVLDPCCGTGGFLISAMTKMFNDTIKNKKLKGNDLLNDPDILNIKRNQLIGIEEQSYMFTIATTNMILRGDGKSNLINGDFFKQSSYDLQRRGCTVGMMNPPYSMGSKDNPNLYEINFVKHLLDSLVVGSKCAVIVPQSIFKSDSKDASKKLNMNDSFKKNILDSHTLEGTIMLNKDTFYGVGTIPCIAIFTAGIPHQASKICKFINFEDDGYKVSPHIGLIKTESAIDKKQHLLDVWFDRVEEHSKFCVKSTVEATDEWLHSFYYFNDEIPSDEDFDKTIADYVAFQVNMVSHGREYLFKNNSKKDK